MGWPVEKVVLLDQSGIMNVYQAKIHSFSGCSSLYATGSATKDGNTYVVRNLDWGEAFCDFSTYVVVFNPTDGSNSVANVIWPGWTFALTALNSKGVYVDMYDGTSMGGQVLAAERPYFEHRVFDFLADGDSTSAVGSLFLSTRVEFPSIRGIADASGDMCSYETTLYDSRRLPDGEIDAAKMREIFELPLFNEDGSFRAGDGPTKPKKQDADITSYTIAADLENLQLWVRLPPSNGEWQHVDLKALFASVSFGRRLSRVECRRVAAGWPTRRSRRSARSATSLSCCAVADLLPP